MWALVKVDFSNTENRQGISPSSPVRLDQACEGTVPKGAKRSVLFFATSKQTEE